MLIRDIFFILFSKNSYSVLYVLGKFFFEFSHKNWSPITFVQSWLKGNKSLQTYRSPAPGDWRLLCLWMEAGDSVHLSHLILVQAKSALEYLLNPRLFFAWHPFKSLVYFYGMWDKADSEKMLLKYCLHWKLARSPPPLWGRGRTVITPHRSDWPESL